MKTKLQPTTVRRLKVRWAEQKWSPKISRKPVAFMARFEMPQPSKNMKHLSTRASLRGFTLIEMLTVIAIIAILAGMLLPTFGKVKNKAQIAAARSSIQGIVAAINQYYGDYSRYPTGPTAPQGLDAVKCPDFTYGTLYNPDPSLEGAPAKTQDQVFMVYDPTSITPTGYQSPNNEVMAILLDQEYYRDRPNSSPRFATPPFKTENWNHVRNPRKKNSYLDAKYTDDTQKAGIGPDLNYRDPWGNPYIITMDLNYDGKCMDSFYRLSGVSWNGLSASGFNGLYNTIDKTPPYQNNFEYNGGIMVWSLGPDSAISTSLPADPKANPKDNPNVDNILSWK